MHLIPSSDGVIGKTYWHKKGNEAHEPQRHGIQTKSTKVEKKGIKWLEHGLSKL